MIAPAAFAATDPRIAAAPYVWERAGAALGSSHGGAWLRATVRGTSRVALRAGRGSSSYGPAPVIAVRVGARAWATMAIDDSNAARELASDLDPAVAYDVEIVIDAPAFGTERWHGGLPAAFVRIDGLVIDAGGALEPAPHPAGSPTLLFGDSIGEGAYDLGIGVTSARSAFPAVLELALDSPVGAVCFAGQGLCYRESPDHVPPLFDLDPAACTWPWYRAGSSRLRAGCFDPAPARIIICIGTNDGFNAHVPGDVSGSVVGFLGALRIAAPEAFLHVVIPFGGFSRDALQAGFTAYRGASGDRRATLIDLGPTVAVGLDRDRETKMRLMRAGDTAAERTNRAYDGLHPDRETHAELGARLAAAIRRAED